MTRRALAVLGVIAVLALAGFGVWRAGQEPAATIAERTEQIAAQLACPTCDGQSVAMSHSEIAGAMRTEIRAQLVAGREPAQIRAWFAERYGPEALLEPPHSGIALVVWWAPAVLLGAGLLVVVAVMRRRGATVGGGPGMPARRGLVVPAAAVAVAAALTAGTLAVTGDPGGTGIELPGPAARAVAENPTDPGAWAALGAALESDGDYARSAEAYRLAADLQPDGVGNRVRLGLVLLKADEPAEAGSVARQILAVRPAHPEGLLVLGLAERAQGMPAASETLRRFLDQAPTHPAAGEVRRLLAHAG